MLLHYPPVLIRVMGYTAANNDTKNTYIGNLTSANWYINNPSAYSTIESVTIPHTGVTL